MRACDGLGASACSPRTCIATPGRCAAPAERRRPGCRVPNAIREPVEAPSRFACASPTASRHHPLEQSIRNAKHMRLPGRSDRRPTAGRASSRRSRGKEDLGASPPWDRAGLSSRLSRGAHSVNRCQTGGPRTRQTHIIGAQRISFESVGEELNCSSQSRTDRDRRSSISSHVCAYDP